MKKLIILILVVLLAFSGVIGYFSMRDKTAQEAGGQEIVVDAASGESAGTDETAAEGYGISFYSVDREAVYALHEPDEVIATVDGRDVTWDEYFYWLSSGAASVENYMMQMAFYGGEMSWEDPWGDDPDASFLDYVIYSAEEQVKPFAVIESIAAEYGVELDEEGQAKVDEELARHRVEAVGEEGTDEDYAAYLRDVEHLTLGTLRTLMCDSALYQAEFTAIFGEDGALVSDEDASAWLAENGYMKANHILLLTTDMDTGEALDETAAAQKQAEAAAIAAQLQAIEDPEALLAKLAELKETWDEDTGKVENPDGYVFTENDSMDGEFIKATQGLREYQVSDPVLSQFGYHVIVRLPLDPETVLGYTSEGTPMTARAACANMRFGELLDEKLLSAKLTYVEGFEVPDLSAYLVEESF